MAEVYFVVSRGFSILPPELLNSFQSNDADNYKSADDNDREVDAEIKRLLKAGFIDTFERVRDDLSSPYSLSPFLETEVTVICNL